MKNYISHKKTTFRFRRWSRKSWAVFHSLGKEVTIGQLSYPMSNQALLKNIILQNFSILSEENIEEEADEKYTEQDLLETKLSALLLAEQNDYINRFTETYTTQKQSLTSHFRKRHVRLFLYIFYNDTIN